MRIVRESVALAAVSLTVAACIPGRDNPYDPSLAPRASLVVKVRTGGPETDVEAREGTLSTVFVLDAHLSTDKGGHGVPKKVEFDLGDGVFREPNEDFDADAVLDSLVLSSGFLLTPGIALDPDDDFTKPDGVPGTGEHGRTFHVRVTGENGHVATASVPVILVNNRPSVPSVDVFVAASGAPPIVLDACNGLVANCAATDPENDSLRYEWSIETGDESIILQPLDANQRRMTFTPVGKRGWEFRVTAIDGTSPLNPDGLSRSLDGRFRVFRSGAFWAGLTQPSRLLRVYPDFSSRDSFRSGGGSLPFELVLAPPLLEPDGAGGMWVGLSYAQTDHVLYRMDGNFNADTTGFAPVSLPTNLSFATDSLRGMAAVDGGVCVLMQNNIDFAEPPERYHVVRVSDAGAIEQNVVVDVAAPGYQPVLMSMGDDACLAIGTSMHRIDAAGSTNPFSGITLQLVPDAVLVNGELWYVNDDGIQRRIWHLPLTASAPTEVPPNGPVFADRLLPHPTSVGVLLHSNDSAFYHVYKDGASYVLLHEEERGLPDLQSGDVRAWPAAVDEGDDAFWHVDPGTYDLRRWVFRSGRWEESGTVPIDDAVEPGVGGSWLSLAIDGGTGRAIALTYQSSGTARVSIVPTHLHRVETVPFPMSASQRFSVDRTSGALYYSDCLLGSIQQFCPDGKGFHRLDASGAVTLTNDATTPVTLAEGESMQLTLAAAQNDNGFWAVRSVVGSQQPNVGLVTRTEIVDFDRDGQQRGEPFPLDPLFPAAALAIGEEGSVCFMRRSPPSMAGQTGSGMGGRIKDGALTNFPDSLECVRQAAVGPDGTCWFVGTPNGTCDNAVNDDRTRILRYPPGSTTATEYLPPNHQVGTQLVVDARPNAGFWLIEPSFNSTRHFDDAGVEVAYFNGASGALAMIRVCDDPVPECLETWRSSGNTLLRGTEDLDAEPVEVIPLGSFGSVRTLSLSPYVFPTGP